jgi:hypothetical protein
MSVVGPGSSPTVKLLPFHREGKQIRFEAAERKKSGKTVDVLLIPPWLGGRAEGFVRSTLL